jgi:methionyl-tRNA formyltransferase
MRIVFMGTPEFAVPSLKSLADAGHEIIAVVTQPDRPRGRGCELSPSPVKVFSIKANYRVLQYEKLRIEGVDDLKSLAPDLIVTAAYGQILSQEILDIPKFGVLNVHASLLPKYRGAAPIQWAVINGEKKSGVTIMKTAFSLDSGDILTVRETEISENETAGELFERLAVIGAVALIDGICLIESGKAVYTPQNHADATYYKTIKKEDARIDFTRTAKEIKDFVRGMNPSPTAFTEINGERVKVYLSEPFDQKINGEKVGELIKEGGIIAVMAGDRPVRLKEIQFPNSKRMSDTEYLRGHKLF